MKFFIFIERELALSPLSETVLVESFVVPDEETLDLTDLWTT